MAAGAVGRRGEDLTQQEHNENNKPSRQDGIAMNQARAVDLPLEAERLEEAADQAIAACGVTPAKL